MEERKPLEMECNQRFLVSSGRPRSLKLEVFCDENNDSAPVHKMSNNRDLVMLEANLTHISRSDMDSTIKVGEDGQRYYVVAGAFYLASTKYMLTCRGKRYDTVMAEYI